jgi:subtilisin family serine protease
MRRCLFVLSAALFVAVPASAQAAEGDIIVHRAPGLDSAERRDLRQDAGVKLVETLSLERTELVEARPGKEDEALAALRADSDVVYAEPDRRVSVTRAMNDSYFNALWALRNTGQWVVSLGAGAPGADIDATHAWDQTQGNGVTVAVVDSGIDADHVDLAGQVVGNPAEIAGLPGVDDDRNGKIDDYRGWDFVSDDNLPQDGYGHGTHVAGTIAAVGANGTGVVGVAPEAKVMPLRTLGDNGIGYMSDVAAAFDYAGDLGVRIVNASIGGPHSQAVESAIAAHPDTLYVVAAGNAAANADTSSGAFPCALKEANLVCVGATDNKDQIASFSNYGATAVDLFAPGVAIYSTYSHSPTGYMFLDGTSMASPHVAGAAALALSIRPTASTSFLRWSLLSSADGKAALSGKSVTGGRLNANAAVNAIQGAEPPPPVETPTPTPEPPVAPPPPAPPVATPAPEAPGVLTPIPTATPPAALSKLTLAGSLRTKSGKLRVSFRLTQLSPVRFAIARRGSKSVLASWSSRGRAGANSVTITRRLPTGKTLRPGSYTLTVGAGATAKRSGLIRVL